MTTAGILRAARKKIERPEAWTKGFYARNVNGIGVKPKSKYAVCWCSAGAINVFARSLDLQNAAYEALIRSIGAEAISTWNDAPERTHAEVMAAFDAAIAEAEREDA